ncbi:MAG TPA: PAS domain-containing sensor histidine kinase, partial [Firmicutes bacterium]|nr:PAS domain-containing sensor histidine kinase [Bacillota bacterium]
SHELRTPLTVIKGYTETLLDEQNWQDPKMAERILTIIDKEAERLSRLLKDLLDLSQIESSKGVMKKQKVDLKNVVEEAVSLLRGHSEAKNLEVNLIIHGHELRNIWGDPDWLLQMFIDILENAIKYTPQGGRIEIKLQEKGKELLAAVKDTGIGIPARNIPYIFERFYRVDKGRSRRLGGTGLGLAIVKHILEAHGGHVTVESSVGVGTTFSVYLPLAPVAV